MRDLLQEIISDIGRNKLRTALTGISVTTGIFLLITLLGAGNGLINAFRHNSGQFATNALYVWPGYRQQPYDGLSQWSSVRFDNRDIRTIDEAFPREVDAAVGNVELQGLTATRGDQHMSCRLTGVQPEQQDLDKITLLAGRFINDSDLGERRKSVVLPRRMAQTLFGTEQAAVGRPLSIDNLAFRVVGVYADQGMGNFGSSPQGYIALSTAQLLNHGRPDLTSLLLHTRGLTDDEQSDRFDQSLRRSLASLHRFAADDETAVFTYNAVKGAEEQEKAYRIISSALWIVGLLTLFSGVAGISNIMLITVRERTHEFGIRKALGARPWSILKTVLLESVVITAIFGYAGLVLGIAGTEIMGRLAGERTLSLFGNTFYYFLDPSVDLRIAFEALAVLVAAGLAAGFVPAWKAVRIRPIEALNAR